MRTERVPERAESTVLAWAGWELRIADDWRPLRIEGGWHKGAIVIGDAEEAVAQVKWWRHGRRRFNPRRWLRRRLRTVRGAARVRPMPAPAGFAETAWVPEYAPRRRGHGSLWYGHAPDPGLVIEVLMRAQVSKQNEKRLADWVPRTLRVSAAAEPTRWAVYGASFVSPPGFILADRRLALGDIALAFRSRRRERLVLRQVYPAQLALARRGLAVWLESAPFDERRRFRSTAPPESWLLERDGRTIDGLKRTGQKRLPFPLGRCRPLSTVAAAVLDRELDRLLLAEHDAPRSADETMLAELLCRMNWALRPGAAKA